MKNQFIQVVVVADYYDFDLICGAFKQKSSN